MRSTNRTFSAILALCLPLLSLTIAPALADPVKIGDNEAFNVTVGVGKMTAFDRAKALQHNVDNALVAATDRSPQAVAITYVNGQPIITLGGFYVASVDAATAKHFGLTTSALAERWQSGLKNALANRQAVESYVAQLTGSGNVPQVGTTSTGSGSYNYYKQGRVIFIPAGMTMPVVLNTALSSEYAKAGDPVQATLSQPLNLGDAQIPANSVLLGQVTDSIPGARMSHSGHLGLKFTALRTPDGQQIPITAHITGGLGKYDEVNGSTDEFKGESTKQKVEDAALRGAIGAGGGALLGTVVGAIASHGYGTGRGAWSGATIGAALGVADSLFLRKGSNVKIESGQPLTLLLDAPAQIASNF